MEGVGHPVGRVVGTERGLSRGGRVAEWRPCEGLGTRAGGRKTRASGRRRSRKHGLRLLRSLLFGPASSAKNPLRASRRLPPFVASKIASSSLQVLERRCSQIRFPNLCLPLAPLPPQRLPRSLRVRTLSTVFALN